MFCEGVCFYKDVFRDSELDFLFSGELTRAAIEFFVEMPLLAPLELTRPPKLLPLSFWILFFRIGVCLPGYVFMVELRFTSARLCAELYKFFVALFC